MTKPQFTVAWDVDAAEYVIVSLRGVDEGTRLRLDAETASVIDRICLAIGAQAKARLSETN